MYIPFRQGDVFRPTQKTKIALEQCFNPFGTGQCLTTQEVFQIDNTLFGLNPFGTGQCLTTALELSEKQRKGRLNPFGTGQCLTT